MLAKIINMSVKSFIYDMKTSTEQAQNHHGWEFVGFLNLGSFGDPSCVVFLSVWEMLVLRKFEVHDSCVNRRPTLFKAEIL